MTDYDTTLFFRNISEGLVLVQDIEITLRQYIEMVYPDEGARNVALIKVFGTNKQNPTQSRKAYSELTFGNTLHFIINDQIWHQFQDTFAPKDLFFRLIDATRDIRNQLAHFRGGLEPIQHGLLLNALQWLSTRPRRAPSQPLEVSSIMTGEPVLGTPALRQSGGKYEPLCEWLKQQEQRAVRVSFQQIEALLSESLPSSARQHRSWWSNDRSTHTQALAWLDAGWWIEEVDLNAEEVTFRYSMNVLMQVFFADLLARLKARRLGATSATKTHAQNWFSFGAGRSGFAFTWFFGRNNTVGVQLTIGTGDQTTNKRLFDVLQQQHQAIENSLVHPLSGIGWMNTNPAGFPLADQPKSPIRPNKSRSIRSGFCTIH